MRIARDLIVVLRYKLRMFGVPLYGPADVMCDNQGVVNNMSLPQLNLSKKHNAVNFYVVQEAAAEGILRVGKEGIDTNLADLLTNMLGWKRQHKMLPDLFYSY